MNATIKEVYFYTHELIKKNSELINQIKELVMDPANQRSEKYLCTGLKIDDIYLGIDFVKRHIQKFPKILINTFFIDLQSRQRADLSRVLLRVFVDGVHVANLTEDVSENGAFKIFDEGCFFGPYSDYLSRFFKPDIAQSVFIVYTEQPLSRRETRNRLLKPPLVPIRMPIIDLEDAALLDPFSSLYQECANEELEKILNQYTLEIGQG
ncbi:MAG: hypothetical protein WC523_06075 [Patescibacteria group bacterium]